MAIRIASIIIYRIQFDVTVAKNNNDVLFTGISNDYRPKYNYYTLVQAGGALPQQIGVKPDGTIVSGGSGVATGNWYTGTIVATC